MKTKRGLKWLFLVALVGLLLYLVMVPQDSDTRGALPLTQLFGNGTSMRFTGWETFSYYLSYWINYYTNFPWVVRCAYTIVLVSCFMMIGAIIALLYNIYEKQRQRKTYYGLIDKYYDEIIAICKSQEYIYKDEAAQRLDIRPNKRFRTLQMRCFIYIFIQVRKQLGSDINLNNLESVYDAINIKTFVCKRIEVSKHKESIRLLQAVIVLGMRIPEGNLAKVVNSKDEDVRKLSRGYYMFTSKSDPYRFINSEMLGMNYSSLDDMKLHQALVDCKRSGRKVPPPIAAS